MIQLIRVYRDGRVITAEAYDHDDRGIDPHTNPYERCRCIPDPLWYQRYKVLEWEYPDDKVTATTIYPTTRKRNT